MFPASLPGRAREKHGAPGNGALLDHLEDDGHGPPRLLLANEALRRGARLEGGGIDAEAADVGVGRHELEALAAALGANNHRLGLEEDEQLACRTLLKGSGASRDATHSGHLGGDWNLWFEKIVLLVLSGDGSGVLQFNLLQRLDKSRHLEMWLTELAMVWRLVGRSYRGCHVVVQDWDGFSSA